MIAMLLLGSLFGWIGMRYRRGLEQQAILERISASGGFVYIGDEECRPTKRDLFFDGNYIDRIDRVFIFNLEAGADLASLARLKNLKALEVVATDINDLMPLTSWTAPGSVV